MQISTENTWIRIARNIGRVTHPELLANCHIERQQVIPQSIR